MALPKRIVELSERFSSLPGIGPKLSSRIALYLSITNKTLADRMVQSLNSAMQEIRQCEQCFNVTDNGSLCHICTDTQRDNSKLLVVETALDLYTIEDTSEYDGQYHVLNGMISPVNGIGPDELTIDQLINRLENDTEIKEVIFGLNPTIEGDSTVMYISEEMKRNGIEVNATRLATGIPTGGSIEYMSSQTITDSLKKRDIVV
jgi:recombination protein RecR